jgi:hypothetical protein
VDGKLGQIALFGEGSVKARSFDLFAVEGTEGFEAGELRHGVSPVRSVIFVMTESQAASRAKHVRDVGRTPVDAAPAGRGGADFVCRFSGRAKLGEPRILDMRPSGLPYWDYQRVLFVL